jgi:hypothetical protein
MKCLVIVDSLAIFVLLSFVPGRAQGGSPPAIPKRKFNHQAEIVSVYDKATDRTSVVMQWYRFTGEPKKPASFSQTEPLRIGIRAGFAYPGHVLKSTPASIEFDIGFEREGKSLFKGKEPPELMAIVDGEQISLGRTLLKTSRTWVEVHGSTRQLSDDTLEATFNYQGLLRLANARKVEMKVGQVEFELKENHLEALRDLASRMVP